MLGLSRRLHACCYCTFVDRGTGGHSQLHILTSKPETPQRGVCIYSEYWNLKRKTNAPVFSSLWGHVCSGTTFAENGCGLCVPYPLGLWGINQCFHCTFRPTTPSLERRLQDALCPVRVRGIFQCSYGFNDHKLNAAAEMRKRPQSGVHDTEGLTPKCATHL